MISTASAGGTITNFSPRFSLTGMTGVFPANVAAAAKEVQGTQGPAAVNALVAAAAPGVGDDEFDVPYAMQTGLTKFAPMQPVPPTKITKSKATPLYPPSDVPIATTFLPPPSQLATTTQPQTFSTQSHENTVGPTPLPTSPVTRRVCLGAEPPDSLFAVLGLFRDPWALILCYCQILVDLVRSFILYRFLIFLFGEDPLFEVQFWVDIFLRPLLAV